MRRRSSACCRPSTTSCAASRAAGCGSKRGELQAAAGEAERDFERAIAIAARQRAKSLELRAAMSLCRLRTAPGRGEDARRRLAEVYNSFTEGFDTRDLIDARELLRTAP